MGRLPAGLIAVTVWQLGMGGGCAASLSNTQPAHVAAKGHVQAEMGADVSVPTGTIAKTVDAARTLVDAAQSRSLTTAEKQQIFDAGTNLALNPPGFGYHAGLAVGVVDRLEVSLRYQVAAWRVGARWQVLRQARDGVDLAAGLGVARYTFAFPIDNVLDVLKLEDFTRWQVDVPILVGKSSDFYRVWAGPKLMLTKYDTAVTLTLPAAGGGSTTDLAGVHGTGLYVGAQAGAALGYRHVFVAVELTLAELLSTAHLDGLGQTRDVDISSFIVYPSVALMLEI